MGKRDELRGLKENVIVGRLIPAGTGLAYHIARHQKIDGRSSVEQSAAAEQENPFVEPVSLESVLGGTAETEESGAAEE